MPALFAVLSRAVVRIRIGGAGEGQSGKGSGGESDLAHFVSSLSVDEVFYLGKRRSHFQVFKSQRSIAKSPNVLLIKINATVMSRTVCLFFKSGSLPCRSGPLPHAAGLPVQLSRCPAGLLSYLQFIPESHVFDMGHVGFFPGGEGGGRDA